MGCWRLIKYISLLLWWATHIIRNLGAPTFSKFPRSATIFTWPSTCTLTFCQPLGDSLYHSRIFPPASPPLPPQPAPLPRAVSLCEFCLCAGCCCAAGGCCVNLSARTVTAHWAAVRSSCRGCQLYRGPAAPHQGSEQLSDLSPRHASNCAVGAGNTRAAHHSNHSFQFEFRLSLVAATVSRLWRSVKEAAVARWRLTGLSRPPRHTPAGVSRGLH